jgi:FMN-dependent oxidoreductase (nitrilotriacetate monooxygenase family)
MQTKKILLNAFDMNCVGHQSCGLWRHPRDRSSEYTSMRYWQDLAKTLERGLFDAIFLADVTGVYDVYEGKPDAALRSAVQIPTNDPFTLVPVMAAVTEHLGFGVTGSIPYEPPYAFARRMSSLDHLTDGRIGWNVVTGYLDSAAKGIGKKTQTTHDTRYDIAAEYMEVVYKLWEGSWEDEAVVRDKQSAMFTDPGKVHQISHHGDYFNLDAIHLCEPSPQRSPVIFQAGTSEKGQAFAASHAECIFIGSTDIPGTKKVVDNLRRLAVENGRQAQDLKILTMASVVVAGTETQAQEKFRDYSQYASHEGALALMSGWSGIDMSAYDLQQHVENVTTEAIQTAMLSVGSRTVGDWAESLAVGGASPTIVGSPETVADNLQRWVAETGIDGFNLAYTVMPECIEDFVDLVIPVLQERGAYKTSYQDGSFREKLFNKGARLTSPHPGTQYRTHSDA